MVSATTPSPDFPPAKRQKLEEKQNSYFFEEFDLEPLFLQILFLREDFKDKEEVDKDVRRGIENIFAGLTNFRVFLVHVQDPLKVLQIFEEYLKGQNLSEDEIERALAIFTATREFCLKNSSLLVEVNNLMKKFELYKKLADVSFIQKVLENCQSQNADLKKEAKKNLVDILELKRFQDKSENKKLLEIARLLSLEPEELSTFFYSVYPLKGLLGQASLVQININANIHPNVVEKEIQISIPNEFNAHIPKLMDLIAISWINRDDLLKEEERKILEKFKENNQLHVFANGLFARIFNKFESISWLEFLAIVLDQLNETTKNDLLSKLSFLGHLKPNEYSLSDPPHEMKECVALLCSAPAMASFKQAQIEVRNYLNLSE